MVSLWQSSDTEKKSVRKEKKRERVREKKAREKVKYLPLLSDTSYNS